MAAPEVGNLEASLEAKTEEQIKAAHDAFSDSLKGPLLLEITAYAKAREDLLKAESDKSWDRRARNEASDAEKKASAIILGIREFEREITFGNLPSEAVPGPHTLDMGGQFLTNKNRIEQESKLFQIAQDVPKGAILHLHFNAELHPQKLLEQARKMDNMCIRSTQRIEKAEDLDLTEMVFSVKHLADIKPANIFSEHYPSGKDNNFKDAKIEPTLWMKWSDFQSEFKKLYGHLYPSTSASAFDNGALPNSSEAAPVSLEPAEVWLLQKMVLSENEAYSPSQTVNGVWARFNQATRCFKGLLNYEKVYKWYISNAIDHMIEDKVMYAELRPMLLDKSIPTNTGQGKITNAGQMHLIIEGVKEKQEALKERGQGHLFPFGLKIIYCTPRSIPKSMMRAEMMDCIDLKIRYPDLICGFDLVGAEDRPNNVGYYYEELKAFQKICKEKDLDIPFLFHAGETLLDTGGMKEPSKSNLYDACLLKSKRIGHGFSLLKHPHLLDYFKKTDTQPGICIELCPISNELLHLCRNIKEHPYPALLAAGVPCTVNSDNPSLFGNSMSHEFYQIMVGAPSMTIHSWKQLALWSLEYSCLSPAQIKEGKEIFSKSWKTFCEDIVARYEIVKNNENPEALGNFIQGEDGYTFKIDVDKAAKSYNAMKQLVRKS